jgi:hypothetical protein
MQAGKQEQAIPLPLACAGLFHTTTGYQPSHKTFSFSNFNIINPTLFRLPFP